MVTDESVETPDEGQTFNPWTVVNLVFGHLVDNGLHPVFGETGDPSGPATDLLRALGVEPGPERPAHTQTDISQKLAEMRVTMLAGDPGVGEAED